VLKIEDVISKAVSETIKEIETRCHVRTSEEQRRSIKASVVIEVGRFIGKESQERKR
tara:strand:+ start:108 stop:278 length:171 start_codon:yes stop_codon:yes gene_type:complete